MSVFSIWRLLPALAIVLGLGWAVALPAQEPADPDDASPERVAEAVDLVINGEAGEPWMVGDSGDLIEEIEWLRADGFDTVICPFRKRIDYEPGEIECGLIRVPENREVPDSRTIELHFVRIAARGENADGEPVEIRDDPVIYLTGGPGVTVEGYVRRLKDHGLVAKRDLYILEQRGIGYSGDFCPFYLDRNRADVVRHDWHEQQMASFEQARQCARQAAEAGVDVSAYHTFEIARDVKALRLALNLPRWNVWGISYGSALGQAYLQVDPDGARATILDAIVPIDLDQLMRIPHWHTRNLDRLFAACAEQRSCARVYPDLERRYRAAIARMSERPVTLEVIADERYPDGLVTIFQDLIAGLPFSLWYEESTHPALPAIIDGLSRAVETGDEQVFRAVALTEQGGGFGISMGMAMAVRCLDGYVDRWAEAAPDDFRDYPTLARAFGSLRAIGQAPAMCREAGLEPRDPASFQPLETDLPMLVVNGAWDPITPVPLAEAIMPGLSNAELAIFPHAGHGPTRSVDCAGDLMNDWFDDPSQPVNRDCVESGGEAARFVAPYFKTTAVTRGLVMHAESPDQLRRHGILAVSALAVSTGGVLGLFSAWLRRRFQIRAMKSAGGARFLMLLAALAIVLHVAGLGLVARSTAEITEAMLLFGLLPSAMWFAWLAPLGLVLAVLALVQAWRHRQRVGAASQFGLWLIALGTVMASIISWLWDLWPIF
ncbi:MAG: alpha/beta hydrolase [Wenzhouxiangella sp.]